MTATIDYKLSFMIIFTHNKRCNQMTLENPERSLEEIAVQVVVWLEDLIQVTQDAADHISRGLAIIWLSDEDVIFCPPRSKCPCPSELEHK
jgi:hypothetical protein